MPSPALRRGTEINSFTYSLYACSPYRGCGHGCSYCDGRAEKYYVEGDFARDIVVRADLPLRLAEDLAKVRERGPVCLGSGVTDAYQPREGELRIARSLAEAIAGTENPLPVVILTKSARILEDLGLWTSINARSAVLVMVSIASLDEDVRRRFEPGASPFAERLEVLRRFKEAGCLTGALAMPFLPGITDGEASMDALFAALAGVGVDFALAGGLTLRPGRQKDHYMEVLRANRPDLVPLYDDIYREERASGMPLWKAREDLGRKIGKAAAALPRMVPHEGLRRLLEPHDELAILFQEMIPAYSGRGVDTTRLVAATDAYRAWLRLRRGEFRRRRTLPGSWLRERLIEAVRTGELERVLGNEKLAAFASRVVSDGELLDGATMKLVAPSMKPPAPLWAK